MEQTKANILRLWEIDVLRAFAMVLVVLFHALCMMIAPAHFPESSEIYAEKYTWLTSACLWFHMPLFIFLSGGVYGYLSNTGKYEDSVKFIRNKAHRLLLPYVCFACLFMLTTSSWSWESLFRGPGYTHLWFLLMLFWCFVVITVMTALQKVIHWSKSGELLVLAAAAVCLFLPDIWPHILGLNYLFRWFFWFYLGYVVYLRKSSVLQTIQKSVVLPFLLPVVYALCMWCVIQESLLEHAIVRTFVSQVGFLSIVVWLWYVCCRSIEVFGGEWTRCRLIMELSKCSFGIYIFHYWLQAFMISRTAQRLLPLADWAANHTVLFPMAFFLLSLLISYLVTKIVLMTRLGRALLG